MEAHCQCRAVHFKTPLAEPWGVYHCHCRQCREQSCSAFGTSAVFPDFDLPMSTQPIGVYTYPTRAGFVKDCFFCKLCGSRVMHKGRREEQAVGEVGGDFVTVKGGCIDGLDWSGGVHIYCEEAVVNLEFPEGVKTFKKDDNGEVWGKRRVDSHKS